ncbi:MAG: metallophosphoesterase [Anaerolineae bacterium]
MKEYNLLVVSDLHLSEGLDPENGRFSRIEDFFFDDAFARFLRYHEDAKEQPRFGGRPWLLILNGDLFDFLQVVSLPQEGRLLRTVKRGIEHHKELRINERDYGLGTTAGESEWKLKQIARGHRRFFAALGRFVAHGNHIAVLPGNHDIELYWPQVQRRFVTEVKRAYTRERRMLGEGLPVTLKECRTRVYFYPWFYHEPGRVYVEHGGQYEAVNRFRNYLNPTMPDNPEHIELPWGSLFVRYLFNELEEVHPFADNVKPITRYLGWALRKDPAGTIEVLLTKGLVVSRAFWNVTRKTLASTRHGAQSEVRVEQPSSVPLPLNVVKEIAALAQRRVDALWREWVFSAVQSLLSMLTLIIVLTFVFLAGMTLVNDPSWITIVYLGAAVLAYFLRRGLKRTFASLSADDYLLHVARELEQTLKPDHAVQYVVLGHDHHAALERLERAWYVNTGAWVPIYEREGPVEGREELTFFRLAWGHKGVPELMRWDDAAGAPARAML